MPSPYYDPTDETDSPDFGDNTDALGTAVAPNPVVPSPVRMPQQQGPGNAGGASPSLPEMLRGLAHGRPTQSPVRNGPVVAPGASVSGSGMGGGPSLPDMLRGLAHGKPTNPGEGRIFGVPQAPEALPQNLTGALTAPTAPQSVPPSAGPAVPQAFPDYQVVGAPGDTGGPAPQQLAPPSNMASDIATGIARGVPVARKQIGGAAAMVGGMLPGRLGQSLTRAGEEEISQANARIGEMPPAAGMAGRIAESVPGLAGAVGAGIATGGAGAIPFLTGAATAGAQSGGGQYADTMARLREQGMPEEQARQVARTEAAPAAVFSAITNTIPMGRYLGKLAPNVIKRATDAAIGRLGKTTAGHLLIDAAAEGSQEAAEQVFQNAMQIVAEDDPATFAKLTEGVPESALGGFFLGGGVSTGMHFAGRANSQGAPPDSSTPTTGPRKYVQNQALEGGLSRPGVAEGIPPGAEPAPDVRGGVPGERHVPEVKPPAGELVQQPPIAQGNAGDLRTGGTEPVVEPLRGGAGDVGVSRDHVGVGGVHSQDNTGRSSAVLGEGSQSSTRNTLANGKPIAPADRAMLVREWEKASADLAEGAVQGPERDRLQKRVDRIEAVLSPRQSPEEAAKAVTAQANAPEPTEAPISAGANPFEQAKREANQRLPGNIPAAERLEPYRGVAKPEQNAPSGEVANTGRTELGNKSGENLSQNRQTETEHPLGGLDPAALRASFDRQGPGHVKAGRELDAMVADNTLRDVDRDVILEALHDTPGEHMGRANFKSADLKRVGQMVTREGKNKAGQAATSYTVQVKKGLASIADAEGNAVTGFHNAPDVQAAVVALHEFGHFGHRAILTPEERAQVEASYVKARGKRKGHFQEGLSGAGSEAKSNAEHFAQGMDEWFAQGFAEWVINGQVSKGRMSALLKKIGDVFRKAVERLRGRKRTPEMEPVFELLTGKRKRATARPESATEAPRTDAQTGKADTNRVARETKPAKRETFDPERGLMLAAGETPRTSSGRNTTPFPKVDTSSEGKARNTLRRVDQWLIDNAIAEAKARGDDFNLTHFARERADNYPPASRSMANEYLFGDQPPVIPDITKPLTPKESPNALEVPNQVSSPESTPAVRGEAGRPVQPGDGGAREQGVEAQGAERTGERGQEDQAPKAADDVLKTDSGPEPDPHAQRNQDDLGFYSRVDRFLAEKMKGPMQGPQLLRAMENAGLSPDEIKWTGLDEFLGDKAKVSPEEMKQYLAENRVVIKEKTLGGEGASKIAELTREIDRLRNEMARASHPATVRDPSELVQNRTDIQRQLRAAMDERERLLNEQPAGQSAQYEQFTLPGGTNYREVLLTLPKGGQPFDPEKVRIQQSTRSTTQGTVEIFYDGKLLMQLADDPKLQPGGTYKRRSEEYWRIEAEKIFKQQDKGSFRSSHFSEPNIIAHMRVKDRTTPDGKRVLFAEEVQSDWLQAAREHGFKEDADTKGWTANAMAGVGQSEHAPTTYSVLNAQGEEVGRVGANSASEAIRQASADKNRNAVPPAPFSKTWHEMAFRRLVRVAAEGGYDAVGWTTGATQADRYEMSRHVSSLKYAKRENGTFDLGAMARGGRGDWQSIAKGIKPEQLDGFVGAGLADKIRAGEGSKQGVYTFLHEADFTTLTEEGKGMAEFYDRILPRYASKFAKKWGAKATEGTVQLGGTYSGHTGNQTGHETAPAHVLPITDAMRDSVLGEGVHLFGPSPDDPSEPVFPHDFNRTPPAKPPLGVLIPRHPTLGKPAEALAAEAFARTQQDITGGNWITGNLTKWVGRADNVVKHFASEVGKRAEGRIEAAEGATRKAAALRADADRIAQTDPTEAYRLNQLASRVEKAGASAKAGAEMRKLAAADLRAFASNLGQFSRLAQKAENADTIELAKILKPLSRAEVRDLGRLGMGYEVENPSPAVKAANAAMLKLMDHGEAGMDKAAQLGMKRRAADGRMRALRGSGHWMPQSLNAEGRAVMKDLAEHGMASPKLAAVAEEMVASGNFDTHEEALKELFEFMDARTRGVNHYFERTRTLLPERLIDFNVRHVVPNVIRKNARTVAAGRVFGGFDERNQLPDVENTTVLLRQYGDDAGGALKQVAGQLEKYIGIELQKPPGSMTQRKFAANVLAVQNIGKLSGLFTPIRNLGQPWINQADAGLLPRLRAYLVDYPLFANRVLPRSQRLEQRARLAGSTTNRAILADLPEDVPEGLSRIQSVTGYLQARSELNNQVRSDIIGRYEAEQGLRQLMALEGKSGPLRKLWAVTTNGFGPASARATIERRMVRLGLTPDTLATKVAKGERLTPEELDLAGWHAAHDTQFAMTTASKPLFYETNPLLRIPAQYKTFGIRQAGLVYERFLKEAFRGNVRPLASLVLSALVFGELVAILRDYLMGNDSAANTKLRKGEYKDAATRALKNMLQIGTFGAIADINRGLADWLLGPTGGTFADLVKAGTDVLRRPTLTQAELAGKDLAEGQAPALKAWRESIRGALRTNERAIATRKIRSEAANFAQKTKQKDAGDLIADEIKNRLIGLDRYAATGSTLTHQYAARAITAGDTRAAARYMHDLIAGAETNAELDKILTGLQASESRSAPLGGMGEDARAAYLKTLTPERRRAVLSVDREWRKDYNTALRAAAKAAREEKRANRKP